MLNANRFMIICNRDRYVQIELGLFGAKSRGITGDTIAHGE